MHVIPGTVNEVFGVGYVYSTSASFSYRVCSLLQSVAVSVLLLLMPKMFVTLCNLCEWWSILLSTSVNTLPALATCVNAVFHIPIGAFTNVHAQQHMLHCSLNCSDFM